MSWGWQAGAIGAVLIALSGCGAPSGREAAPGAGGASSGAARAQAGSIPAAELPAYLAAHPGTLLLDVRYPEEWNDHLGHIEGAKLVPLPELESRLGELSEWKDKPVVTVCAVGARSATAARRLAAAGFTTVYNLEGGMAAYRAAGH